MFIKKILSQKSSIVYKMTIFTVIIIVIQSLFLITALVSGGVLNQAKLNAYESFRDKVKNRKSYLELEMKNRWTNFDPVLNRIAQKLSTNNDSSEMMLENLSADIIEILRVTKATGSFIMLTDDINATEFPSFYVRDYDPISINDFNQDLYVVAGSPEIARKYKIPLDRTWSYDFKLTKENEDFIKKPLDFSNLSNDSKLLGYWSKPFKLTKDDLEIMTYTMPIYDSNNKLKGIIGIEITMNHLIKMLPATDLQLKDSLGYIITHKPAGDSAPIPAVMVGALQKRYINKDQPLNLISENEEFKIYRLKNHKGSYDIYAGVEELRLYQSNTPFEDESWYLVGLMREEDLFSYVNRINWILWGAFAIALIFGLVGGIYFSYKFSKPIVDLSRKVRSSNKNEIMELNVTGLSEVDELAVAMQEANLERIESVSRLSRIISSFELAIAAFEIKNNQEDIFVTEKLFSILEFTSNDKNTFRLELNKILANPAENEEGVYRLNAVTEKWLKIKITESKDFTIGVVQDVTDEMIEKLQIRRERDIDPLTRLLNRRAFESYMNQLLIKNPIKTSALVMFDLDNLKIINDTFGHKWGDFYIKEAVQRLNAITERHQMLLSRRSGDEFTLLLYGFNNRQEIINCMDKFYVYLNESLLRFPTGEISKISISGGLTWIEKWPMDYEIILHKADEALYISKFNNKGSWTQE